MFTISKETTANKIKNEVRSTVIEFLMEELKNKYGEDNVRMVRTGGTTKTNEIGFIVDDATDTNGDINAVVVVLNPTVKEFSTHTSAKGKNYVPFDFAAAAEEYDNYVEEKEEKAAAKAAEKAKKSK